MAITKSPLSVLGRPASNREPRWPIQKLFDACFSGNLDAAHDLVRIHGKDLIEKTDSAGDRPINAAAGEGHLAVVQFLVEAGMPFDKQGRSGTPLYDAAYGGQLEVVAYLLDQGADINSLCRSGTGSPLMGAIYPTCATDVAVYLLERGASVGPEIKDQDGKGVLDWVMERDNARVYVAMAKKGLLPKRGQVSALECAVYLAHLGKPETGKITDIVVACLEDPELCCEPSEERLWDMANISQHAEVRGMLLAAATAAALKEAIPDSSVAERPAVRRESPSL